MLLAMLFVAGCGDEKVDLTEERIRADEAEQVSMTKENFPKLIANYKTDYVARGAHAKAHSCVRAYFIVNKDIAPRWRYGVFADPGKHYRTWIRFSNGRFDLSASQDHRDDARGVALKLLELEQTPLEIDDVDTHTQDFLLVNSPVFFVRNMADYNQLIAKPEDFLGFFFRSWNPASWKLKELLTAAKTLTAPPASLLDPDYFSITPYKLGPHNVKYGLKPCVKSKQKEIVIDENTDPDFLQKQLAQALAEQGACFDFAIQEQKPESGMSLDDATSPWSEEDSAFIKLARVSIEKQSFLGAEQLRFCENLSFAPWHALPAHRPIGELNRLRRHAYAASSAYRHKENATAVPAALEFWCRHRRLTCDE